MRFIAARRLNQSWLVWFTLLGAVCLLPFADLSLGQHNAFGLLAEMASAFLWPDFGAIEDIGLGLALTIAFAIVGVALSAVAGFAFAPFYGHFGVRAFCIATRSIHELFWGLILLQAMGLGAPAGVLAIALPYTGFFAKVFAEYLEEADQRPSDALPKGTDALSRFFYTRLPLAWARIKSYALYRLECGLRSSAVLGFFGLPTLGFQLDSFFRNGDYNAASAILIIYVIMIATMRFWARPLMLPLYLVASIGVLAWWPSPPTGQGAFWRFLTQDIVPAPLRNGDGFSGLLEWFSSIALTQALPGLIATFVCAYLALVLTGMIAMLSFGALVPKVTAKPLRIVGHVFLVIARSIPEYMLAYIFLQAFGPSMLPAILALGLHNGAIIAHLLGQQGKGVVKTLRPDAPHGITLLTWEFIPRLFGQFIALCLYRLEWILRETAVMGLLGIATLGFYIDEAFARLQADRVMVLLLFAILASAFVDALSRWIRRQLQVQSVTARQETQADIPMPAVSPRPAKIN